MGKLFGTDGIRGMANRYPITAEMALKIGKAAAICFKNSSDKTKIIIGKDTRISGDMIESAIAAGICSMGADVYLAGIIPTPGVAYLTSFKNADAGIVISASHNPYYDNGIKFFSSKGFKLSEKTENTIEDLVVKEALDTNENLTGRIYRIDKAEEIYADFLKQTIDLNSPLKNLKLVLDCSNGSTCKIAPALFSGLGADVISIFTKPDGININAECGSEHPEELCKMVVDKNAGMGLAFDGDGDRLVAVDEKGSILTGDQVIAVCSKRLKDKGLLKNNIVVTTVMSNLGLKKSLKKMGIKHVTTKVGDRCVMEKMVSTGAVIGGEDSGHMIFMQHHTTGDGILSALKLVEAATDSSKPLSELAAEVMTVFPQIQIGVKVSAKPDLESIDKIVQAAKSVESSLNGKGRVLIRYSGTQPVCRVMVEGPSLKDTERFCKQIADVVKEKIGV